MVDRGWGLYHNADLVESSAQVEGAIAALSCQPRVLAAEELLDLFRLQSVLALSQDDSDGMDLALRRALAVDHTARPPEAHGPEIGAAWDALATVLTGDLVEITLATPGIVWVDGRPLTPAGPLQVVKGIHLVQFEGPGRTDTRVAALQGDTMLTTTPDPALPSAVSLPDPAIPSAPPAAPRRRRPTALWAAAAGTGGFAIAALASGYRSEGSFLGSPYQATAFGSCAYDAACYPQARIDVIEADAARINAAYGVGYAMAAATGSLLTIAIVGLPPRE